MTHSTDRFASKHSGAKSKEVLEQELFSLLNSKRSIKTATEKKQWEDAWKKSHDEYSKRFPNKDPIEEWKKWAKKRK